MVILQGIRKRRVGGNGMTRKISKIALNLILLLLGVVTVYPFVWMLASSFKKNSEIMALEQHLLPQIFTAENYINMNERFNFMRFFANSLFVTTSILCVFSRTVYLSRSRLRLL